MDMPTENLIGRQYGSWTVLAYDGKYRTKRMTSDRWKRQCRCGVVRSILRGNLARLRDGCSECPKPAKPEPHPSTPWWNRIRRNCTWTKEEFQAWFANRNGNCLARKDATKPHGPDNSYWGRSKRNSDCRDIVLKSLTDKGMPLTEAVAHVDSLSRQRIWQLANVARGLCTNCGQPSVANKHCDRCWEYKRKYAKDRYVRKNKYITLTVDGETHTIREWSEITGIPAHVIYSRRRIGWDDARCVRDSIRGKITIDMALKWLP